MTTTPSPPLTILIVDDDPTSRELCEGYLAHEAHTLVMARDGEEAWRQVILHPPDLVLVDIMMPRLNGYYLCQRMKKDNRTQAIPILGMSAVGKFEMSADHPLGPDDFLAKPFTREQLLNKITQLVRKRSPGSSGSGKS